MLIYGSELRVSEAVNLKIKDIDSKKMRIFVRGGNRIKTERTRVFFRRYRRKAKINEKFVVHSLRHEFATDLIEKSKIIGGKSIRCIYEGGKVENDGNTKNNRNRNERIYRKE